MNHKADKNSFKLSFFSTPKSQKHLFLNSTELEHQKRAAEIEQEIEFLQNPHHRPKCSGNLLYQLGKTFPKLLTKLAFFQTLGRVFFLGGLLASKNMIDGDIDLPTGIVLLILIAITQLGTLGSYFFSKSIQGQFSAATSLFLVSRINSKLASVDFSKTDDAMRSGTIKVLLSSDVKLIQFFVNGLTSNLMPTAITVIIFAPAIWFEMGWAGLAAFITAFSLLPISYFLSKWVNLFQYQIQAREGEVTSFVGEWLKQVRLVRYFGLEGEFSSRIKSLVKKLLTTASKQHLIVVINFSLSMLWWLVPILLLYAIITTTNTLYTIGGLFASIWMINLLSNTIRYLPFAMLNYAVASACLERLNNLFSVPDINSKFKELSNIANKQFLPQFIIFDAVSLSYDGKVVCQNLNIRINLSVKTGIIGKVGSGKTALVKALTGELAPNRGNILIEMANGKKYDLWCEDIYKLYRQFIGYVPQRSYLSSDEIKNNIALSQKVDHEKLNDAINLAQMAPDIQSFANGYNEEIGEFGGNLSGGQKQRINIARAIYFDRLFLILDDAFSSLDGNTGSLIFEELVSRPHGFILITHRLKALERVDRILILENGSVVQYANYSQLTSQKSYADFIDAQQANPQKNEC